MFGLAKAVLRSAILSWLAIIILLLGRLFRLRARRFRRHEIGNITGTRNQQSRVLLIRLDLLGDVIFSLAAARAIKRMWPSSRVTMATLPQTALFAAGSPDVDDVIAIDTNAARSPLTLLRRETLSHYRSAIDALLSSRFSLTVSLYGRTASLLALLSRSSERIGYADEAYRGALDRVFPNGRLRPRLRQHDTAYGERLIENAAGKYPMHSLDAPRISAGAEARTAIERLLAENGVSTGDKVVVMHAGSGYGDFKRWPPSSFAELADRLSEFGAKSLIIGTESEASIVREIEMYSGAVSIAGKTSPQALIALLERADVIVSGDSGPLHLATALGTPAVAIYGPTDPAVNGPIAWNEQPVTLLRRDLACSPCYSVRTRAECPLGDPICMRLVTVDAVFESVERILRLGSRSATTTTAMA